MKMRVKKFIAVIASFAMSVALFGCFGKDVSKTISVTDDYTSLEISSAIKVEWSETAEQAVISAGEDVIDAVVIERRGETLSVYVRVDMRRSYGFSRTVVVLPASDDLRNLTISGASLFESEVPLDSDELKIKVSGASFFKADIDDAETLYVTCTGASKFEGNVYAGQMTMNVGGASAVTISGEADVASFDVSGASSLKGLEKDFMVTEEAVFDIGGASRVVVDCKGSISGSVSGASSLRYGKSARGTTLRTAGASSSRP